MELVKKTCIPCEGGVPRLTPDEARALGAQIPGWQIVDDHRKLQKRFVFDDFMGAIAFVNRMAELAEREGHHPDFSVRYSVVDVTVHTHVIGGLSENDFILAAKIDQKIDQVDQIAQIDPRR